MSSSILDTIALGLFFFAALANHLMPAVLAFETAHPQKFTILAVSLVPLVGFVLGMGLLEPSEALLRKERRALADEERASMAQVRKIATTRPGAAAVLAGC